MKKNLKILQELLNEARGLKGMLAEVGIKSRLMANQILADNADPEAEESISQMQSDLDKYSQRLNQIYAELNVYGISSKLE
jgi:hypothetical protein